MGEVHAIHPVPEVMAPVVFVKLFGNRNAKIKELHFDSAFIAPYVLNDIVAPPEKAAKCLTLDIGHLYGVEPIILEFPRDKLGIDTVGLRVFFLSSTVYIGGIGNDRTPSERLEDAMGGKAAQPAS